MGGCGCVSPGRRLLAQMLPLLIKEQGEKSLSFACIHLTQDQAPREGFYVLETVNYETSFLKLLRHWLRVLRLLFIFLKNAQVGSQETDCATNYHGGIK